MADILFLPTCSACGQIIKEDIGAYDSLIYPMHCPNCGILLNAIVMPRCSEYNEFNWNYEDWKVFMEWM